eukprot:PhF_6_TR7052/c1_g1_i5/m.10624
MRYNLCRGYRNSCFMAIMFLCLTHRSSSSSYAGMRILMANVEVYGYLSEVWNTFQNKDRTSSDSTSSVLLFISQGMSDLQCLGNMEVTSQRLIPVLQVLCQLAVVPVVSLAFMRWIPFDCWRHTTCSMLFLIIVVSFRGLLQTFSCVEGVNMYHPALTCASPEAATIVSVFVIVILISFTLLFAVFMYVTLSHSAGNRVWPVFHGVYVKTTIGKMWSWIVLLRRVLFVAAVVVGSQLERPEWAYSLVGIVAVLFGALQHFMCPYRNDWDNHVEYMCLVGISILCFVGPVVSTKEGFHAMGALSLLVPTLNVLNRYLRDSARMFNDLGKKPVKDNRNDILMESID